MPPDRDEDQPLLVQLARVRWRLDALDKKRDETDVRLDDLERRVGSLTRADEIAEAIAKKMKEERTLHLTLVQKAFALAISGVSLASLLHGLGAW